jgi:hypothetical protein
MPGKYVDVGQALYALKPLDQEKRNKMSSGTQSLTLVNPWNINFDTYQRIHKPCCFPLLLDPTLLHKIIDFLSRPPDHRFLLRSTLFRLHQAVYRGTPFSQSRQTQ